MYNAMTTQQMACANCMSPDMTKTLSSPVTIVNINKDIDDIKKNNWIDIFLPILSTIKAANAIPHASHNDWKTEKISKNFQKNTTSNNIQVLVYMYIIPTCVFPRINYTKNKKNIYYLPTKR